MNVETVYLFVVIGLGFIFVIIGFLTVPNRLKEPVPVSAVYADNTGDRHTSFNYQAEEQNFLIELDYRPMEQKPNQGEDYQKEKQRRDVDAFAGYCDAGLLKIITPEVSNSGRS